MLSWVAWKKFYNLGAWWIWIYSFYKNTEDPDQLASDEAICVCVLLRYVPSQQLWSLRAGQFT